MLFRSKSMLAPPLRGSPQASMRQTSEGLVVTDIPAGRRDSCITRPVCSWMVCHPQDQPNDRPHRPKAWMRNDWPVCCAIQRACRQSCSKRAREVSTLHRPDHAQVAGKACAITMADKIKAHNASDSANPQGRSPIGNASEKDLQDDMPSCCNKRPQPSISLCL